MKKIFYTLVFIFCSLQLLAQAPQRLSYQAVIRNSNNVLMLNAPIKMRLTVLQGSITGTSVYSELHSTTTNANGVAFVEIGGGSPISGSFATINWGQGIYFLRSETDPNNGTNYTIIGTTQLVSVPYSLYANRAAQADNGFPANGNYGALQLFNCNGRIQYTPCLPILTTTTLNAITANTAVSGGNISNDGGGFISSKGVVWGTAQNPTIALTTRTNNGVGSEAFQSNITGLLPNTTYFVRAFATNSAGTSYGNQLSFRTGRAPVVSTGTITAITLNGATGGGNVTDSGSSSVTARGLVWSTSPNPTIALTTRTNNGTGLGLFSAGITGLLPNTLYYVRAYATNSAGTSYGTEQSFRTARLPVLTTTPATEITTNSAISGGNITDSGSARIIARGVIWAFNDNITLDLPTKTSNGTGIGAFSSNITGLLPNVMYYARAYATTSLGTSFGNQIIFATAPGPRMPLVSTQNLTELTPFSVFVFWNVSDSGSASVTARGLVWSVSPNPTIASANRTNNGIGIGNFSTNITGLIPNTLYYVRAYATNSVGTAYGQEITFRTPIAPRIPVLTTNSITFITSNSALGGGNVTDSGSARVTARGIVWSTSPNPTISLTSRTNNGTGTGIFDSKISTLVPNTLYYVRAYATNSAGTAYGNEISFRTVVATRIPVLTTTAVSSITLNSAMSGGNVTDSGTARVTARGVVWGTSENPTIALPTQTVNGPGTGAFTASMTGLTANTIYYVRAYATNSVGTAYGNQVIFNTGALGTQFNPNLTYGSVTDIDNNKYRTIQIGAATWMAENLRVTRYRNGVSIPQVMDSSSWQNNTTGAWCYYNNDSSNNMIYGKLYNGYVVGNVNQICPTGWHVASESDWSALGKFLGGATIAGSKMKSTGSQFWFPSPLGIPPATNSSGFSAVAGGFRWYGFRDFGTKGIWWFDNIAVPTYGLPQSLSNSSDELMIHDYGNEFGLSIRCVKDANIP